MDKQSRWEGRVDKKDLVDILCRTGIVLFAIGTVAGLEYMALSKGVNGVGLATSIATILSLALAFLGVKVKDVLFK